MKQNLCRAKKQKAFIFDVALVFFIVLWYRFFGCPLKFFFGLSCAGCGMTRAVVALFHGDFSLAWHFHPLVFLLPVLLLGFFLRKRFSKKFLTVAVVAVFVLFTVVFFVRLFGGSDVVRPDFTNSAVFGLFEKIKRR